MTAILILLLLNWKRAVVECKVLSVQSFRELHLFVFYDLKLVQDGKVPCMISDQSIPLKYQ
jgi:hypothetical protein